MSSKTQTLQALAEKMAGGSNEGFSLPSHHDVSLTAPITDYASMLPMAHVVNVMGVTRTTVNLRVKEGRLHPIKVKGKLFFNPQEVEQEVQRVINDRTLHAQAIRGRNMATLAKSPPPPPPPGTVALAPKRGPGRPRKYPISESPPRVKKDPTPTKNESYTGEQAAQAVSLFLAGKSQLEVIMEMKITFELAEHFWDAYLRAQPCWVLTPKVFAQLRTTYDDWDEDQPTPEGLADALRKFVSREVERELKASLKRRISEEPLTPDEQSALAEADAEADEHEAHKKKAAEKAAELAAQLASAVVPKE
jgi:hypothetical protein